MKNILTAILIMSCICLDAEARTVKGKVTCGKEKLAGVVVTDGENFAKTGRNGKFRMEINDDAPFVYIVTPAGYSADWSSGCPQFYLKAEGQDFFPFDLVKTSDREDTYSIIAVGDPQPRKEKHSDEFAGKPLDDLSATAAQLEGQAVGIALGDICFDVLPLLDRWKQDIVRAGIPFYPVVGNHDHDRNFEGDKESIGAYRAAFGPENYAFMIGDDIVFILDNIIYHSRSGYELGYTEEIIRWVNGMMEYVPEDADIYVAQHSPLNGRHYKKMVTRHQELLEAFEGHQVTFLSGHNHTNGNFEYAPGVFEHNVAAICGTWWDVYHCTDGTPRGYKVLTETNDELTWYYKSIGRDKSFQHELFRPGETRLHPDCVVVNVWDYDPQWSIEWYEDGKPMGAMERVKEYSPLHTAEMNAAYAKTGKTPSDYRLTKESDHYFAARPSAGAKKVTVVIKDRFGHTWKEEVTL